MTHAPPPAFDSTTPAGALVTSTSSTARLRHHLRSPRSWKSPPRDKRDFYCPNGHAMIFRRTTAMSSADERDAAGRQRDRRAARRRRDTRRACRRPQTTRRHHRRPFHPPAFCRASAACAHTATAPSRIQPATPKTKHPGRSDEPTEIHHGILKAFNAGTYTATVDPHVDNHVRRDRPRRPRHRRREMLATAAPSPSSTPTTPGRRPLRHLDQLLIESLCDTIDA
jgi:hypothetical protein